MVAIGSRLPSIPDFIAANPNAPPDEMLAVVVAETERLKLENDALKLRNDEWVQEWRVTSEVALDEHFNFKPKTFSQLRRLAKMYSDSESVPEHYRGKLEDTTIAVQMALRCNVDIMTFLQSSYVVYGKPGIEGKLVIAILNCSSQLNGRVDFEYTREGGKITSCRAFAKDKSGKELSQTVTWDMVTAEGWDKDKKGQTSKWKTIPDLMFAYRSATFLARVYFPDVLMGMHTVDELEDILPTGDAQLQPAATGGSLAELSNRIGASLKPANGKKQPAKVDAVEPTTQKQTSGHNLDNDPFAPNEERNPVPKAPAKASAPSESKQATKVEEPKKPAAASSTAKNSPPEPTKQPTKEPRPNAAQLKGFIDLTYTDADLADFDVERIIAACVGIADFKRLVDSILARKHPQHGDYLKAELRSEPNDFVPDNEPVTEEPEIEGDDDVSQETPESSEDVEVETGEDNQDIPEFIRTPVKRPKLGIMATEAESTIIGKRNPEMIRRYLAAEVDGENHPHLEKPEQAYLLSLGNRRAYQLEHSLPTTDRLPK